MLLLQQVLLLQQSAVKEALRPIKPKTLLLQIVLCLLLLLLLLLHV